MLRNFLILILTFCALVIPMKSAFGGALEKTIAIDEKLQLNSYYFMYNHLEELRRGLVGADPFEGGLAVRLPKEIFDTGEGALIYFLGMKTNNLSQWLGKKIRNIGSEEVEVASPYSLSAKAGTSSATIVSPRNVTNYSAVSNGVSKAVSMPVKVIGNVLRAGGTVILLYGILEMGEDGFATLIMSQDQRVDVAGRIETTQLWLSKEIGKLNVALEVANSR
jgi:hypothetical protein